MNAVTLNRPADIVAELEALLDLPSWPDPVLPWVSSSISQAHPGKRYHRGLWCKRMNTVSRPVWYDLTVGQVGTRRCYECTHSDVELTAGVRRQKVEQFLAAIRTFADALDGGSETDDMAKSLIRTVRLRVDETRNSDVQEWCADAVSRLLAVRAARSDTQDNHAVLCAALLLRPIAAFKPSDRFAREVPEIGPQSKLVSTHSLKDAWKAFCAVLGTDEGTVAEAKVRAIHALLPLKWGPHNVSQLEGLAVTATVPGQLVTIADLIGAWTSATEQHVKEVVDVWAARTDDLVSLGAQAGTLKVLLRNDYSSANGRASVQDFYGSRYPSTVEAGGLTVEVPATVAEYLRLSANGKFVPSETYPASTLDVAGRLISEGLDPMEAYATAKVIDAPDALAA